MKVNNTNNGKMHMCHKKGHIIWKTDFRDGQPFTCHVLYFHTRVQVARQSFSVYFLLQNIFRHYHNDIRSLDIAVSDKVEKQLTVNESSSLLRLLQSFIV